MTRTRDRIMLTSAVADCCRCHLASVTDPVPPILAREPGGLLVIGDVPTARDVRSGRPFTPSNGPGRHLDRALTDANYPLDRVSFVNVVSCQPTRPGVGKALADRPPTDVEKAACRHHLAAVIRHVEPVAALILGGTALSAFRFDLRLNKVVGLVFRFYEFGLTAGVVTHPMTLIRDRDRPGLAAWREGVSAFAERVASGSEIPLTAWRVCVACGVGQQRGVPIHSIDCDGAAYCYSHRKSSKAVQVASKWRTLDNKTLQTAML